MTQNHLIKKNCGLLATLLIGSQHQRYLAPNQGLRADDAEWAMTIDPGGGAEWMVDLEGWGSDLCVAGSGHRIIFITSSRLQLVHISQ